MIRDLEYHRILNKLYVYAEMRKSSVKKKLETPRLAALLVEKYALGMNEVLRELVLDLEKEEDNLWKISKSLCIDIDPDFEQNKKLRWEARPADLQF